MAGVTAAGVAAAARRMGGWAAMPVAVGLVAATPAADALPPAGGPPVPVGCMVPAVHSPEYYEIELVPTRRVTGTGRATGTAAVSFAQTPFGVEVASDGSYRLTLAVETDGLPDPADGAFVAWVSTPDLSEVRRIGALDGEGSASGAVVWNKFLVFVTMEPEEGTQETWTGPVVLRGMSRSGMMHTMAGHGPFEQQECSVYGY